MTDAQKAALEHIHKWHGVEIPLADFIRSAQPQIGWQDGSLIVQAGGIWIGIEADGSRHS